MPAENKTTVLLKGGQGGTLSRKEAEKLVWLSPFIWRDLMRESTMVGKK